MTAEIYSENNQDLIIRGTKEAIDLEVQRLRDEGQPILIWRDGKVVDIREELDLQDTGRGWFLIGIAFLLFIPIWFLMISFGFQALMPVNVMKSFAMLFGVMCLGAFGLGAWYGEKKTRRSCLVFMAVMLPIIAWLVYSYFVNGFFAV